MATQLNRPLRRLAGDMAVTGKGEIFAPAVKNPGPRYAAAFQKPTISAAVAGVSRSSAAKATAMWAGESAARVASTIARAVGQPNPAAWHRMSAASGWSPCIRRRTTSTDKSQISASAAKVCFVRPPRANSSTLAWSSSPRRCRTRTVADGLGLLGGVRRLAGHFGYNGRDLAALVVARNRHEPVAHLACRSEHEAAQHGGRDVMTLHQLFRQDRVGCGALDQRRQPGLGEPRPVIEREVSRHVAVAAFDQRVGDRLVQPAPARYGQEVGLALGHDDGDQLVVLEMCCAREHRRRYRDVRVAGEPAHDPWGRVADGREATRELGERRVVDRHHEAPQHAVEQIHMLGVEAARSGEEEAGHAPHHLGMPVDRDVTERLFQFGQEGGLSGRHRATS